MEKPAIDGGVPLADEKRFIRFCPPLIEQDDLDAVAAVLKTGWLSTGARAQEFEAAFRSYTGAKNSLAVNSCTAALHLSLIAHGIGPGDEVLVPAMTFAATANVVEHVGARPVFVDSEDGTFNIDPEKIEGRITKKTKAVIPVHFGGLPCEMDAIRKIGDERGLKVIEDCAHAIGTRYRGRLMGSSDNLCCFSFYPTKNMTTIEGGMVTGADEGSFSRMRVLSLHGMSKDAFKRFSKEGAAHYEIEAPGFKYNMPDVSAALGLSQLKKIGRFNRIRERYASYMLDRLQEAPGIIAPPKAPPHATHSWHLFPLMVDPDNTKMTRDRMLEALKKENIGTGVHYRSLHIHRFYREKYGLKKEDCPRAAFISDNVFSVPFSHSMSEGELEIVADAVVRIARCYKR
ncbi:MAG: DegT/DnrJ/EryC1/StrS family aminotransferase [Candidatus Micrarchaeota archaeon]